MSARGIFQATDVQGQNRVVYHQTASPDWKTCIVIGGVLSANCGMCAMADELARDTYVTVYENKIEYNYPIALHCCCMYDRHGLLYLDREIASKVDKAGCCYPMCTHNNCCPTCFDACGEGVVFYGATACSKNQVLLAHETISCCRTSTMVRILKMNTLIPQVDFTPVSGIEIEGDSSRGILACLLPPLPPLPPLPLPLHNLHPVKFLDGSALNHKFPPETEETFAAAFVIFNTYP